MPLITELRDDIKKYIQKHGLSKKWEKPRIFLKMILPTHLSILNCLSPNIVWSIRSESTGNIVRYSFACLATKQKLSLLQSTTVNNHDKALRNEDIFSGLLVIVLFVLIRAASFNHVDYLLSKWRIIGPFKMKYLAELGGSSLLGEGLFRTFVVEKHTMKSLYACD